MSAFRTAIVLVAALAFGAGAVLLLRQAIEPADPGPAAMPAAAPVAAPTPAPTPTPAAPVAAPLPLPTVEASGVPLEQCIAYPDGSRLPPLNGVTKAPQMVFHKLTPFTKIVGRERDARGVEWYVHENGMRSTTRLQLRNGVTEAVAEVSMPATPQAIVDDK